MRASTNRSSGRSDRASSVQRVGGCRRAAARAHPIPVGGRARVPSQSSRNGSAAARGVRSPHGPAAGVAPRVQCDRQPLRERGAGERRTGATAGRGGMRALAHRVQASPRPPSGFRGRPGRSTPRSAGRRAPSTASFRAPSGGVETVELRRRQGRAGGCRAGERRRAGGFQAARSASPSTTLRRRHQLDRPVALRRACPRPAGSRYATARCSGGRAAVCMQVALEALAEQHGQRLALTGAVDQGRVRRARVPSRGRRRRRSRRRRGSGSRCGGSAAVAGVGRGRRVHVTAGRGTGGRGLHVLDPSEGADVAARRCRGRAARTGWSVASAVTQASSRCEHASSVSPKRRSSSAVGSAARLASVAEIRRHAGGEAGTGESLARSARSSVSRVRGRRSG